MNIIETLLGSTNKVTQEQEKIHCGEVFGLWQHLVQRYDILELTDIFQNFSHDLDFKALLRIGLDILNEEIELLEKELNKFGIPLPPRPPKSINTPSNTEILRDELMFRTIYTGIQYFVIQQSKTLLAMQYEPLQNLFAKFEQKEMDYYIKLSKYGNLKGWLFIPPSYTVKY